MKIYFSHFKNIKTLVILTVFYAFGSIAQAQQFKPNTEVGLLLGTSYYLGDLNTTHFNNSAFTAGLIVRENIDRRFSYKAELLYLNIAADDANNPVDTIALGRGLSFQSAVYELSGQIEFNFLPYDPGNALYTWTPFVYTGISIFNFNPRSENKDGLLVNLQELGTEGQGTEEFLDRKEYPLIQIAIPFGGGVKIAINESFNIIFEYGIRKTFTDYIDDVSKTYPGKDVLLLTEFGIAAYEMSDPTASRVQGEQRGDPNKRDWYSFAGVTLSFKLNNNSKECDY